MTLLSEFREAFSGDAAPIGEEILGIFVEETPGRMIRLRTSLEQNDVEEAAAIVHSLANTIGSLKVHEALATARSLEHELRSNGCTGHAMQLHTDLQAQVQAILGEIV